MIKPAGLRRLLLATVLDGASDKLSMFIDKGRLIARPSGNLHFEYRYTLNLVVQEYSGSIDALMVPILAWIAEQEPGLLDRAPNEPFSFESELLDADTADVSINIDLSERVRVTRTGTSTFTAAHLDEPSRGDNFPDVCGVVLAGGMMVDEDGTEVTLIP